MELRRIPKVQSDVGEIYLFALQVSGQHTGNVAQFSPVPQSVVHFRPQIKNALIRRVARQGAPPDAGLGREQSHPAPGGLEYVVIPGAHSVCACALAPNRPKIRRTMLNLIAFHASDTAACLSSSSSAEP